MLNRNWLTSDWQQRRGCAVRNRSLLRKTKLKLALAFFAWTLLGAALLLSGCHTLPNQPCETQPLPTMPALSEPIPLVSYSLQWQRLAQEWQKRLTFTQTTPEK